MSYTYIIRTILRFPSVQQRKRAFSTCSSHLIVVSITYGTCIFIYIKPHAKEGVAINKVVSVLTTSVAPVMNPFIYTLRNKQVVQAFKDMIKRVASYFKGLKWLLSTKEKIVKVFLGIHLFFSNGMLAMVLYTTISFCYT